MTLVQALSVGGGPNARGTQKGIRVMRRGTDSKMKTIEVSLSDILQPDDVIYVRESLF
jgi:polysaccharide export outer membrane protein